MPCEDSLQMKVDGDEFIDIVTCEVRALVQLLSLAINFVM